MCMIFRVSWPSQAPQTRLDQAVANAAALKGRYVALPWTIRQPVLKVYCRAEVLLDESLSSARFPVHPRSQPILYEPRRGGPK